MNFVFLTAWVDKWERLNVTLTQLAEEMKHNETLRQMWLDHLKHFEEKEVTLPRPILYLIGFSWNFFTYAMDARLHH